MIKFLINKSVSIAIDTDDAEKSEIHVWEGKKSQVEALKTALQKNCGMHGHLIGDSSPAIDVHHALFYSAGMKSFEIDVVEGQEILDAWQPRKMPKGEVY